jgi:hypothetical protein
MSCVTVCGRRSLRRRDWLSAGSPSVLRAKTWGENPVYYVLGKTHAGKHLFCVVVAFPDGKVILSLGAT